MCNLYTKAIYSLLYLIAVLTSCCSGSNSQQKPVEPFQEATDAMADNSDKPKPLDPFLGIHNKYLKVELETARDEVEAVLKEMYDTAKFHETYESVCALCHGKSELTHQKFCDFIENYGIGTRRYGSWKEEPIYVYARRDDVSRLDYAVGFMMDAIIVSPEFWYLFAKKIVFKTKKFNFQAEPFSFQRCVHCTTQEDLQKFAQDIYDNQDAIAKAEADIVRKRLKERKKKPGFSFF